MFHNIPGCTFEYDTLEDSAVITGFKTELETLDLIIPARLDGLPVTIVDDYAFLRRGELSSVVIPDSVVDIGSDAFCGCSALKTVQLPEELRRIGPRAFCGDARLSGVELPGSVTELGRGAFYGCESLDRLILPTGLSGIGQGCFDNCAGLVICCSEGSPAHRYALENGHRFELIPQQHGKNGGAVL